MAFLTDELWLKIFSLGVEAGFQCRELCSLALVSRRLKRLAGEGGLWERMYVRDFSASSQNTPPGEARNLPRAWKTAYAARYEQDRERRRAQRQRAVLRAQSRVVQAEREVRQLRESGAKEQQRLGDVRRQIRELEHATRVSRTGGTVWLPLAVQQRHSQVVEQAPVSAEGRLQALRQEEGLGRMELGWQGKALASRQALLATARRELQSLEFTPAPSVGAGGGARRAHVADLNADPRARGVRGGGVLELAAQSTGRKKRRRLEATSMVLASD